MVALPEELAEHGRGPSRGSPWYGRSMPEMTAEATLDGLVRGVRLLCLDAGNTVIFLDHARLAGWATARGQTLTRETLIRTEGEAKLRQEQGSLLEVAWDGSHLPGASGWGKTVGTILHLGGASPETVARWLDELWVDHVRLNLWSLVPPDLVPSLEAARALGLKVAVVSNSEGMLDELFVALGIRAQIDLLLDSGKLGVEKPDPRIFRLALDAFGVGPREALHLGDSIATDVLGARAAGIPVALIDPFGHCEGRATDVPRVASVAEVARAWCKEHASSSK
jgi:HAD superfamily hydrolase (TIGR01509 family)